MSSFVGLGIRVEGFTWVMMSFGAISCLYNLPVDLQRLKIAK